MENGDTVRATISDYTISYSSDLSYDQNGDPLVENPKSLQQATLVAVLPDGAASEESFVVDVPENQIRMALDNLFPTLPENVAIEGNVLYDTENAIVMAELTAVESIEDPSDPFFHYDQLYAEAVQIEEGNWGGYSGKWYWLQEEITGEAVGGFENHIVYCIQAEESMILITFHPVRGIGGIGPQREAFEEILDTIRRENG